MLSPAVSRALGRDETVITAEVAREDIDCAEAFTAAARAILRADDAI